MKKIVKIGVPLLLVAVIAVCGVWLFRDMSMNNQIEQLANDFKAYDVKNISKLKLDFNEDIVAWLFLDGTNIEFPVVKGPDNDYYLNRDAKKEYCEAGSIFMDYRCEEDFSMFNTVIYGHNLRNGTMFSNLKDYGDASFFESHPYGTLYTETSEYKLEIFAYFLVDMYSDVYELAFVDPASRQEHLQFIEESALLSRDIGVTINDRIVTISTCNRALGKSGRSIVLARLVDTILFH